MNADVVKVIFEFVDPSSFALLAVVGAEHAPAHVVQYLSWENAVKFCLWSRSTEKIFRAAGLNTFGMFSVISYAYKILGALRGRPPVILRQCVADSASSPPGTVALGVLLLAAALAPLPAQDVDNVREAAFRGLSPTEKHSLIRATVRVVKAGGLRGWPCSGDCTCKWWANAMVIAGGNAMVRFLAPVLVAGSVRFPRGV